MKRQHWALLGIAAALLTPILIVPHCRRPDVRQEPLAAAEAPQVAADRVREPAVAGAFYPDDREELAEQVDGLLAKVQPDPVPNLRALVCPHAGYVYSGLTAAHCYKQLAGRQLDTVAVLAPSHRHRFDGASIPDVDAYRTPLGLMRLAPKARDLARMAPFVSDPRAHAQEHSLEVQLPFLQRMVGGAKLVPIVLGRVDPQEVARKLDEQLDPGVLLVVSSDLSHYHPYADARRLDRAAIDAILALDLDRMQVAEACGKLPLMALIALAKQKGWQTRLLDYRNSGDTAGSKAKVVGYAAIAFYAPAGEPTHG